MICKPLTALLLLAALATVIDGCASTGGAPSTATQTQVNQSTTATLAGLGACGGYLRKHHDASVVLMRLDQADAALAHGIGYDALKALLLGSVNPDDALYFAAGLTLVEPMIKDRTATIVLGSQPAVIIKALIDGCRSAAMILGTQKAGGSGADPWGGEGGAILDPWGVQAGGGAVDPWGAVATDCKAAKNCGALPLWPGSRF